MKKAFLISLGCEDRLKIIRNVLKEKYSCRIFISDFDHTKKKYIENKDSECEYIHVPNYNKNISFGRINAYISFSHQIGGVLKRENPELVYVMLPPNTIAYECAKYKEKYPESKLIVDVYDLWPESFPIQGISRYIPHVLNRWKGYRNYALEHADYIFTECNYYKKILGSELIPADKTSVLYIHKNQDDDVKQIVEQSIKNYKRESDVVTLGYLGSINNIIDTDGISDLIKGFIKAGMVVKVKIVGGGEGTQRFIESIESAGAHVENYGFVFDSIKNVQIFSTCDFALNMMVSNAVVGLTTKSVDYFSFALPIVNNIKGDTTELVKARKIGINYSGKAEQILNFSNDDIIQMKKNAYQCYLDLMTPQGLFNIAQSALRNTGIL